MISMLMLCFFFFFSFSHNFIYYFILYYIIIHHIILCSSCRNEDQINKHKTIAMMNTRNQDNENRIVTLSTLEEELNPGQNYHKTDRKYNIDETTELSLEHSFHSGNFFSLVSSGLSSLTNLMKIEFKGLVSFPVEELSRLPNLTDLNCNGCKNFAAPVSNHQLTSLKRFTMIGNGPQDSNFNDWIVRSLPVLEELHFGDSVRPDGPNPYPNEDRPSICTTLMSDDCVFNQSLQILKVSDWRMFQNHNVAEIIEGGILPMFPNLRHIDSRHCFCYFEFGSNGMLGTFGTVVASSSDHAATVNENQNTIVTLLTFNEADEDVGVGGCGKYSKIDREYNIDDTTTLDICIGDRVWLLSDSIRGLTNLTKVNLHKTASFPLEQLAILPNLTDLDLSFAHLDVPDSIQFKSLKRLTMTGVQFYNYGPNPRYTSNEWIVRSFPVLEELYYSDISGRRCNQTCICTTLQRDDCVFNQSLQILKISIRLENVAETILVDILPKFPNVRHIDTRMGTTEQLNNNTIFIDSYGFNRECSSKSLKNIAQRLKHIDTSNIKLRTIQGWLNGFLRLKMTTYPEERQILLHDMRETKWVAPVVTVKHLLEDPEETQAMLSILSSFRYLYNIGNYRLNQEVESRLRINHGGGALVDGHSKRDGPIPLNNWPIILERVYDQSKCTFAKNISLKWTFDDDINAVTDNDNASSKYKERKIGEPFHQDSEFIMGEKNATGIHNLVRSGTLFQHILQLGKMKVPTPPHQTISRKRKDPN